MEYVFQRKKTWKTKLREARYGRVCRGISKEMMEVDGGGIITVVVVAAAIVVAQAINPQKAY